MLTQPDWVDLRPNLLSIDVIITLIRPFKTKPWMIPPQVRNTSRLVIKKTKVPVSELEWGGFFGATEILVLYNIIDYLK